MIIEIEILKKNRKFFACKKDGYACKLVIDAKSENLGLGKHSLDVSDISVRSKYGTDLKYEMLADIKESGVCALESTYNENLVEECRNLGGKWDKEANAWIFSKMVEQEVEALDDVYNSDLITIEIEYLENDSEYGGPVHFAGYPVARAFDRDSGAKLNDGVALLKGEIASAGSRKNWKTFIGEGTVIRMQIPKKLLPVSGADKYKITVLSI